MKNYRLPIKSFDIAINDLKNDIPQPVYFLMGEDYFLQEFFVNQLLKIIQKDKPIQKTILIPDDIGSKDILDRLTSLDLFDSTKLFILRNPNGIKGNLRDELVEYCKNPSEQNILILIQDEYGTKNKMLKELVKISNPISVSIPFESEMVNWVKYFFKKKWIKKHTKRYN